MRTDVLCKRNSQLAGLIRMIANSMYANDKSRLLKIIALDVTQSPTMQDTFQPILGGPHQLYWSYQEIGLQSITVMPLGSFPLGPQLQDKIWEWPGDEASIQIQKEILWSSCQHDIKETKDKTHRDL